MQIKSRVVNKTLYILLSGELDEYTAQSVRKNLDILLETQKGFIQIVMDLSELTFMDSTGVGVLIGRYTMDSSLFSTVLADAAFDLEFHETSPLITYDTDSGTYYYVLYLTDKNDDYFKSNKDAVIASYIGNEIGRILGECKEDLLTTVTREALMGELDRSAIAMP